MTAPFDYPVEPHRRRHGPLGYSDYSLCRPWVRDEFDFRCVYCLQREQWGKLRGVYALDHFVPVAARPDLAAVYDNLVYACITCNGAKGAQILPDPLSALVRSSVSVGEDGTIHARTPEALELVRSLGLDSPEYVEFRSLWIGIVALAARADEALHRRLMSYPDDLPDLRPLDPPGGNSRLGGVAGSAHARRDRCELPPTY
ncbi:MAG: HNH endonuclease [Gemmataceae bacterium]|nr:HNH endonuclease [Gemmataceae bacterium]